MMRTTGAGPPPSQVRDDVSVADDEQFSLSHEEKIQWMIEQEGWALESVRPRSDTDPPTPSYAYTIGVPALVGFPELAVFGLTPAAAKGLIGLVVDACRGGTEIPLGVELVGLLDNELRCLFAPIDVDELGGLFPTTVEWYGGAPFQIVQLLYPDRNGWMPYEDGFEHRLRYAQPIVGAVP